jgi:hypothetical protein
VPGEAAAVDEAGQGELPERLGGIVLEELGQEISLVSSGGATSQPSRRAGLSTLLTVPP